jgi:hypothetical protein
VELFNLKTDFDLTGDGLVWYARPQLFFNCTLCPTGFKATMHGGSHKEVSLVYFSTFEPIDLTPDSIMQRADTQQDRGNGSRLYEVNIWMWRYGRGRPRMVSIAEAERIRPIIRAERLSESRTRAAETRKRRSVAAAAAGAAQGGGGAD